MKKIEAQLKKILKNQRIFKVQFLQFIVYLEFTKTFDNT